MERSQAAALLYLEIRNPLVHELGKDRRSKARPRDAAETIVGRWGRISKSMQRMDRIDARQTWNPAWPVMEYKAGTAERPPHVKLSCVPLYWVVKRMTERLALERSA